jgi:plastocyanin
VAEHNGQGKMKSLIGSILVLASIANAANFQVNVGASGLTYQPNTVMANVGDTVEFIVSGVPLHLGSLTIGTYRHRSSFFITL